jgi:hypothetical protein
MRIGTGGGTATPLPAKIRRQTFFSSFKDQSTGKRFAIHIENKPPFGLWEPQQPENYCKRAANRMSNWRYVDFQVVLIAPVSFIARSISELDHFDIAVSYEALSEFVPEFAHALRETESMGSHMAAESANNYIGQLSDAAEHLSLLDNPVAERLADDADTQQAISTELSPRRSREREPGRG